MHTDGGKQLHLTSLNPWGIGPYVPLVGNVQNTSGITPEQLQRAVIRGMRMWQTASGHAFSFDYWQGSDSTVFVPSMKRDGLSTIFFASADPEGGGLTPSQSAYTRVYFDPETGAIDEVDIVLNDVDMKLTAEPDNADYTGGGSSGHVIVLEDVVAHELGHVLGLGHSGILDSTMFAFGWAGQRDLSCDDVRAVQALYGTEIDEGALTGRVLDANGKPILGAHVVAIELAGPSIAASGISSGDGGFRIAGLPGGSYAVMVEPFMAGPTALDDVYADANLSGGCSGTRFSRTFYGPQGSVSIAELANSTTLDLGEVQVTCDGVSPTMAAGTLSGAEPPELTFNEDGVLAALLIADPSVPERFAIHTAAGPLDLSFVSYSLFSPAQIRPSLDESDTPAALSTATDAAAGESLLPGDTHLSIGWLPAGEHVVSLDTSLNAAQSYPMGSSYVDDQAFVLVVGRQSGEVPPTSCWGPEPSTDYTSPSGPPRRITVIDEDPFSMHCGVTAPGRPGGGLAWPLVLLAAFGIGVHVRRRRALRSEAIAQRK